jgi:hypothetical protein
MVQNKVPIRWTRAAFAGPASVKLELPHVFPSQNVSDISHEFDLLLFAYIKLVRLIVKIVGKKKKSTAPRHSLKNRFYYF